MALTENQIALLEFNIDSKPYPAVYFDFVNNRKIVTDGMGECESVIRSQLMAEDLLTVKDGLSNIVYWGNASAGYADHRVNEFRAKITVDQLLGFQALINRALAPTLQDIKSLSMPVFSGISFVSKILMFLNPASHSVLDLQITKLATPGGLGAINRIKRQQTSIPINTGNMEAYNDWCRECVAISQLYFDGRYRAADIERRFFSLIRDGKLSEAQAIYITTSKMTA